MKIHYRPLIVLIEAFKNCALEPAEGAKKMSTSQDGSFN